MTLTRFQAPLEDTVEVTPKVDQDEPPVIDPECQENPLVWLVVKLCVVLACVAEVVGIGGKRE